MWERLFSFKEAAHLSMNRPHLVLQLGSLHKLGWGEHPPHLQGNFESFLHELVANLAHALGLGSQICGTEVSWSEELIGHRIVGRLQLLEKRVKSNAGQKPELSTGSTR